MFACNAPFLFFVMNGIRLSVFLSLAAMLDAQKKALLSLPFWVMSNNNPVFALGPSKSLTFEEGVGTLGESQENPEGGPAAAEKVPDPCCPIICERM